jgi:hypothetical protein
VISAIVYDGTGFPVADGTVVQFFTTLGRIDEQGRTNDGVARVNLYADSRSGTATVSAISGSGGAGPAPSPSGGTPSPTATPSPGLTAPPAAQTTKSAAAIAADDSITVTIGSANPTAVLVTASPQRITTPRYAVITANVFEINNNPVSNVPVFFRVALPAENNPPLQESMDSAGNPRFTDNNGRVTDILRTSYDPEAEPKVVKVEVILPGGLAGDVSVVIN